MKRRLISLILCVLLLMSLALPASAINSSETRINISENVYLTLSTAALNNKRADSNYGVTFTISQYVNDELIQRVSGESGGAKVYVTNYEDGLPISQEAVNVSDRVVKTKVVNNITNNMDTSRALRVNGSLLGYITYNPAMYTGEVERIQVYNYIAYTDSESYTINGAASDTIALLASTIASVIFANFLASIAILAASEVIIAIVSSLGGSIVGNVIGIAFSERVAVTSNYYEITGYDYQTNRASSVYEGIGRRVVTRASINFGKWFYDGVTPNSWQDTGLAYLMWCDLFDDTLYNGVRSWS